MYHECSIRQSIDGIITTKNLIPGLPCVAANYGTMMTMLVKHQPSLRVNKHSSSRQFFHQWTNIPGSCTAIVLNTSPGVKHPRRTLQMQPTMFRFWEYRNHTFIQGIFFTFRTVTFESLLFWNDRNSRQKPAAFSLGTGVVQCPFHV